MRPSHPRVLCALAFVFLFAAPRRIFPAQPDAAGRELKNEFVRAAFSGRGLVSLAGLNAGREIAFRDDSFSVTVNGRKTVSGSLSQPELSAAKDKLTYLFAAGELNIRVVYELRPGWRFLSKQLLIEPVKPGVYHVDEIQAFAAQLGAEPREELRLSGGRFGTLLRFAEGERAAPSHGLFLLYQNPFNGWAVSGASIAASYAPDMDWRSDYGPFAADRFCLGPVLLSGVRVPAKAVPEWKFVADYGRYLSENPLIDMAESDALVDCVRAFLLRPPEKSIRVHVPWCENDYQVDVAEAEGWNEYKRIIDRAAELGCGYTLFTPANAALSSLAENRDAWGWENLLFFGLGQKIRKGEWVPSRDPVPPALQRMLDYGRAKGVRFMAYAYPSLPFMQNPEWTRWAGGKVDATHSVDTGVRSFQDWWIRTLVDFVGKTGAGGFSFDHWWLSYKGASSPYAQWFGCRRILEELRRRVPGIVIDGRQTYQTFGPWTWLGGSYPHPTLTDEQPESFTAFPDLHTDRVSADRQRFAAWTYHVERFAPPEITPGFMTHQTERSDAAGVMRRDRFRTRDWDLLGWKYSVISSLGTAPFNHTLSFIPARDTSEFEALSGADKSWLRGWLDWTDRNAPVLRRLKPILGPPMIGRCDGTAALDGDYGFIFLFNPNYRGLTASFKLDESIGLTKGTRFLIRELYPEAGKLVGKPRAGFWNKGDDASLALAGLSAVVLEVAPAPAAVTEPVLFNASGTAVLDGTALKITGVSGESGSSRTIEVVLPPEAAPTGMNINGRVFVLTQTREVAMARVAFGGAPFTRGQAAIGYDPKFAGGTVKGEFAIPGRVFEQLRRRKAAWPVPYTEDDLRATWLGSDRLLLFVQIAEPDESMDVSLRIDGQAVPLTKAYNSIYGHEPKRTFLGFYADVSSLAADRIHGVELTLPALEAGRFQGLYFENVEPETMAELRLDRP